MSILERSSTRLFAPPGGKSSISFGDYTAPTHEPKTAYAQPVARENVNPQPARNIVKRGSQGQSSICFGDDSTPAYVRPNSNQAPVSAAVQGNNGNNFQQPAYGRVKQAPGGNSSFVLG